VSLCAQGGNALEPAGACAQHRTRALAAVAAAVAAFFHGQRGLSTPARTLRRRVAPVEGRVRFADDSERDLRRAGLLAPIERGRFLAGAPGIVALAMVLAR
jgi:hypothetical protein